MCEMGFGRSEAEAALKASHGAIEAALDILLAQQALRLLAAAVSSPLSSSPSTSAAPPRSNFAAPSLTSGKLFGGTPQGGGGEGGEGGEGGGGVSHPVEGEAEFGDKAEGPPQALPPLPPPPLLPHPHHAQVPPRALLLRSHSSSAGVVENNFRSLAAHAVGATADAVGIPVSSLAGELRPIATVKDLGEEANVREGRAASYGERRKRERERGREGGRLRKKRPKRKQPRVLTGRFLAALIACGCLLVPPLESHWRRGNSVLFYSSAEPRVETRCR